MNRRQPIRCIVKRVIGFLLLGAMVNVAVAWGLATWQIQIKAREPSLDPPLEWLQTVPDHWPNPLHGGRKARFGRTISYRSVHEEDVQRYFQQDVLQTGFPRRALQCESKLSWSNSSLLATRTWTGELEGSIIGLPGHHFPCAPIWPGFAINTLFYAGLLWVVFAAPVGLRRRRRIKRGLCPECGYPIGASEVCTECGKLLTLKPRNGAA